MRGEAAGRGGECGRGRRAESGRSSGGGGTQPRGTEHRSKTSSDEVARLKEVLLALSGSDMTAVDSIKDRGAGNGKSVKKAPSDGGEDVDDVTRELRWRLNRLEDEKLELTSSHNQQLCGLQGELVRWRAAVEHGEAERAELQFKLSVALRDGERAAQTNGDLEKQRDLLSERGAELEHRVSDLRSALELMQRGRLQDQRSLQQDLDERESLIQKLTQDNSRLHELLTSQSQTLEQSEQRINALQRDVEREAELKRRQADELRYLGDREERLRGDKEFVEQKVKALEANVEAERAAHLESKFNSEIVQLRLRDLEAALAAERSHLQEATLSAARLKERLRETEEKREQEQQRSSQTLTQLHRLQEEFAQCKSDLSAEKRVTSDLSVALETEKRTTSSLRERLESETRERENATARLQQVTQEQRTTQDAFVKFVQDIKETLQQHLAEDSGSWSPGETLEKLRTLLCSKRQRQEEANKQIEELLFASEQLLDENQALKKLGTQQKTRMEGCEQVTEQLRQEVTRLQTEGCDWSKHCRALQVEAERERDERRQERAKMEDALSAVKEEQRRQDEERVSSLRGLLQRLQPQSIMGDVSWDELWFRVGERVEQLDADFSQAQRQVSSLQSVLSRLEERLRRREQDWSRKHRDAVAQLQRRLQTSRAECRSLQDHVNSLTSDLSALCHQSGRFQWACLLLGGALAHAQVRVERLTEQKALLCRSVLERDALEQEVRSLWAALEAEEEDEEQQKKRARRRWRRAFNAVTALRRWCMLGKTSHVLFTVQVGESSTVGVALCGDDPAREEEHHDRLELIIARWLQSKRLSSVVLSSMSELQGALSGSGNTAAGSSPQSVTSAAQSALSHLLVHLLDQSDAASASSLRERRTKRPTTRPHVLEPVSRLQQHFLDLSQRLHTTEVERRGLRLELSQLRRAAKEREQEVDRMVSSERFDAVCSELQGALCREQEAQSLVLELNSQLTELRSKTDSFSKEKTEALESLDRTAVLLSEARREVSRKERSLRILGKHLCAVQKERRLLERRLRDALHGPQTAAELKDPVTDTKRTSRS